MMKATILLLATFNAGAADAETFVDRGIRYEYSVRDAQGSTLITGRDATNDIPFTLRVFGNQVSGDVAGKPVAFSTRDLVHVQLENVRRAATNQ